MALTGNASHPTRSAPSCPHPARERSAARRRDSHTSRADLGSVRLHGALDMSARREQSQLAAYALVQGELVLQAPDRRAGG